MKRALLPFLLAGALPASDPHIVAGLNAFTVASYRQLTPGGANLILSPFNIAAALSMALSGARGQTATQIATVLHQHYDASYNSALGALIADLDKAGNSGGNQLHNANGLWVQQGLPIQAAFQKTLATDYHAPLTSLDFMANPGAARREINSWTEQHTKDKIKELLPPTAVTAETRLVLTSAIYFYGKWQNPFPVSDTAPAPFKPASGASMQANFMNQTGRFNYTETPAMQVLEMRYLETGMAFDVLLPKVSSGLADLEKSLTAEKLAGWLGNLSMHRVEVILPRFRSESEFSLHSTLSAMGMPLAFSNRADFSGIDARGKLKISEVAHKAFVDVTEQGTEAAAATGITMQPTAMRAPEPAIVFRADHPFVFMIRDTKTGAILFIGRLTKPAA